MKDEIDVMWRDDKCGIIEKECFRPRRRCVMFVIRQWNHSDEGMRRFGMKWLHVVPWLVLLAREAQ